MKQIFQKVSGYCPELIEVPMPFVIPGHILIKSHVSLISTGTERMLVEFGKTTLLGRIKQQPDKVIKVLDRLRTDGLFSTIETVRNRLDQAIPLGYSNVGKVVDISDMPAKDPQFSIGQRVVSNGPHAEYVCVPLNLCAPIPDSVSDEAATFAVLGAIGLQGIRLAQPAIGEMYVVIGLGLIGQLTVQLLLANGCRVIGIDIESTKCELAEEFGAETVNPAKGEDPIEKTAFLSRGRGVDGVLITASTASSEPVHQAAQMCRKRGRIILVGVTGLELSRADFYEKELTFQVSCSYGPGRYDQEYEDKGRDYPFGFVRWTEQRNFKAVLDLMATGKLNLKPLISHRFSFEDALSAYNLITDNSTSSMGVIFAYTDAESTKHGKKIHHREELTIDLKTSQTEIIGSQTAVVAFIGAGNFTEHVLLPAVAETKVRLRTIASAKGISGTRLGRKFGFEKSTTDTNNILNDPEINTVFITTQHNSHADFVIRALKAGKHVFVEKPLCLSLEELQAIVNTYTSFRTRKQAPVIMVGFNRRFSPHVQKTRELLKSTTGPKSMIMTVNAGPVLPEHWTRDPEIGGGRIIGEACHFVDLLRFLAASEIKNSAINRMDDGIGDSATINLTFGDGSIGSIHYFANGNRAFSKEKLDVFCSGKILRLDNFKILRGFGFRKFKKMKLKRQDKGHKNMIQVFIDTVASGKPLPIDFAEFIEVTRTTIELQTRVL
jgi:predicted dehydrogenase/threonine dehydrogenase-like Zn-dependent dehydrogenase